MTNIIITLIVCVFVLPVVLGPELSLMCGALAFTVIAVLENPWRRNRN